MKEKELQEIFIFEEFKLITPDIIPGIALDRYEASNLARVYDKKLKRFIKITQRPDGYKSVSLNTNGEPKSYLLHRIVGLLFVPGDTSLIINHLDCDKGNDNYWNLEWATYSENNIHAFANDLNAKGEDSPKAIISEQQVEMICRYLDEQKLTYQEIAQACNINSPDASSLISAIRRGESWRHISCKYNFSNNYKGNGRYRTINRNLSDK